MAENEEKDRLMPLDNTASAEGIATAAVAQTEEGGTSIVPDTGADAAAALSRRNRRIAHDEKKADNSKMWVSDEDKLKIQDELERTYWFTAGKKMLKDWRLYLMVLPCILVFLFWRYFPLYGLVAAFKDNITAIPIWKRDFVGLNYFVDIISGQKSMFFWQAFRNTFFISFYGLLFGFPMPIIIALFLNEIRSNIVRSGIQVLSYLPRFVSTVVITTIVTFLVKGQGDKSASGIVTKLLETLNLVTAEQAKLGLLRVPEYFRSIYIISDIWEGAGYGSIVFFAAVIAISPTSYEAANIDGATKMQQIRYVVLPGMASTIVIMLILRIGQLMGVGYEKVLLLRTPENYTSAETVSTFVLKEAGLSIAGTGDTNGNQALGSAADLVAAVISMLMVIGSNAISRKVSDVSLY